MARKTFLCSHEQVDMQPPKPVLEQFDRVTLNYSTCRLGSRLEDVHSPSILVYHLPGPWCWIQILTTILMIRTNFIFFCSMFDVERVRRFTHSSINTEQASIFVATLPFSFTYLAILYLSFLSHILPFCGRKSLPIFVDTPSCTCI